MRPPLPQDRRQPISRGPFLDFNPYDRLEEERNKHAEPVGPFPRRYKSLFVSIPQMGRAWNDPLAEYARGRRPLLLHVWELYAPWGLLVGAAVASWFFVDDPKMVFRICVLALAFFLVPSFLIRLVVIGWRRYAPVMVVAALVTVLTLLGTALKGLAVLVIGAGGVLVLVSILFVSRTGLISARWRFREILWINDALQHGDSDQLQIWRTLPFPPDRAVGLVSIHPLVKTDHPLLRAVMGSALPLIPLWILVCLWGGGWWLGAHANEALARLLAAMTALGMLAWPHRDSLAIASAIQSMERVRSSLMERFLTNKEIRPDSRPYFKPVIISTVLTSGRYFFVDLFFLMLLGSVLFSLFLMPIDQVLTAGLFTIGIPLWLLVWRSFFLRRSVFRSAETSYSRTCAEFWKDWREVWSRQDPLPGRRGGLTWELVRKK